MNGYTLAGHELESPLVNAAGSINGVRTEIIVREAADLAQTGIGAITVGSFTIPPQAGNEARYGAPIYYHDAGAGKTYNSMGLPNIGLAAALGLAPEIASRAHDFGKVVILSASPTDALEHGSSVDQAVRLAYELLGTNADLVELNVSCPNVIAGGGRRKPVMGYDPESMRELFERLHVAIGQSGRLGLKLPPYLSDQEKVLVPDLAAMVRAKNVFRFLVTSNAVPNQVALDAQGRSILAVPGGKGAMSGPATKEIGREQLRLWCGHTDIEIVSALGVDSGKELAIRRDLGAAAAGGVTFLWESRNWKAAVTSMLSDFATSQ